MKKRTLSALSLFLAALLLCLTFIPAWAAESSAAAAMLLVRAEGAVNVANGSGRGLSARDNMPLYNGYRVETGAESYAWISLDGAVQIKLDAVGRAEVRKSGRKLELLLTAGSLFFNAAGPLKDDETLNIRTSTMVVDIRGACGWVRVIDRWTAELYVLEGAVQCGVTDPVTGQTKTAQLRGGEKAVAAVWPQDKAGDKCDILMDRFEPDDISGFVLAELARDPGLCGDICEAAGIDVPGHVGLLESVRRQLEVLGEELDSVRARLEEDDPSLDEAQARLDGLRRQMEDIKERLERAEPDDGTRRRLAGAEERLRQAREASDDARAREAAAYLDDARRELEGARQGQFDGALEKAGEEARERREQDEREMRKRLDRIEDELEAQDRGVSGEIDWEVEIPESALDSGVGGSGTSGGVDSAP